MRRLIGTCALAAACAAGPAAAATYTYSFDQLLGGGTIDSVATLTIQDIAGGVNFTLTGEFGEWGDMSFLSRIHFNGPNGMVTVGPGNVFDMPPTYGAHVDGSYTFTWEGIFPVSNAPGSDRFLDGDTASWSIMGSGITTASFTGMAMVHLQGIGPNGEGSIKVLTPIPEPSTYALLLAGLAGTGWWVRRRQARQTVE